MRSTQEKFTNMMQQLADAHELDLVVDSTFSNVVAFRWQREDSFAPVFSFGAQFNPGYASFDSTDDAFHGLGPSYVKPGELDEIVERVADVLDEVAGPVGSPND